MLKESDRLVILGIHQECERGDNPTLPAVRIGRLAVDREFQSRGLGAALLADAAHRTMRVDIRVRVRIGTRRRNY